MQRGMETRRNDVKNLLYGRKAIFYWIEKSGWIQISVLDISSTSLT